MSDLAVDSPDEGSNPDLEAERPDWLPVNFNDPADLAKSWKDGQVALTRAQQDAAEARQAKDHYEALIAQQQQTQQSTQQQSTLDAWNQAIVEAHENGDHARAIQLQNEYYNARDQALMNAFEQKIAPPQGDPFVTDFAVDQSMTATYPDWDSYKERAVSWAKESVPHYDKLPASEKLTLADLGYCKALAQDVKAGTVQPRADRSADKQNAQTMSGASVRQPTQADDAAAWDKIAGAGSTSYSSLFRSGQ